MLAHSRMERLGEGRRQGRKFQNVFLACQLRLPHTYMEREGRGRRTGLKKGGGGDW